MALSRLLLAILLALPLRALPQDKAIWITFGNDDATLVSADFSTYRIASLPKSDSVLMVDGVIFDKSDNTLHQHRFAIPMSGCDQEHGKLVLADNDGNFQSVIEFRKGDLSMAGRLARSLCHPTSMNKEGLRAPKPKV
jgi:hypothetical protein